MYDDTICLADAGYMQLSSGIKWHDGVSGNSIVTGVPFC